MIRVQAEAFQFEKEIAEFTSEAPYSGAIASFVGLVRPKSGDEEVTLLELTHYAGFTERLIAEIVEDATRHFALDACRVVHRFGVMHPGEAIVLVAAASRHRRAALDAVDYLMDRLKTEAPFWKREHGPDGSRWIEAREKDHEDRSRWEK